jgi:hypothetical protein
MEDNLRMGMSVVSDALRNTGYGIPNSGLANWFPSQGLTTEPIIFSANTFKAATCVVTQPPVYILTASPAANATTLTLNTTSNLAAGNVVGINYGTPARVISVGGNTITIDTNLTTANNQGISRIYPVGTPLCRAEVQTFTANTATKKLILNTGSGNREIVQGITSLQIIKPAGTTNRYQVTLTASTTLKKGTPVSRSLVSDIALAN